MRNYDKKLDELYGKESQKYVLLTKEEFEQRILKEREIEQDFTIARVNGMCQDAIIRKCKEVEINVYNEIFEVLQQQEEIAKAKKLESIDDEKLLDAVFYTTKVNVVGEMMQVVKLLAKERGVKL